MMQLSISGTNQVHMTVKIIIKAYILVEAKDLLGWYSFKELGT